jgi:methionyl-tRNA formyltransferase
MRVILAGQRSFGLAAYRTIRQCHDVAAVLSPVDFGGREPDVTSDPLTRQALADGKLLYPVHWTPDQIELLEADLIVAAHSHDFISRAARAATRLGGIGYHPSLLPRHRGRDAVRWTIHMQDPIAGGTVYWLSENVDGGPVAAQDWCFVPRGIWETEDIRTSELWREQLFPMGIRLIMKVLDDLDKKIIIEIPQDESHASWEPSWERPPLHRPDLPQIGGIPGFRHVTVK